MKILIVGTISNSSRGLSQDYRRLRKVFGQIGEAHFYLVESDSKDQTVLKLQEIAKFDSHFRFISLGNLAPSIPDRIERIRFCRNKYVTEIRRSQSLQNWDLIVVADMDGMNPSLRYSSASKIVNIPSWDACFANQTFGYYDILALRAINWVESDCFLALKHLKESNEFTSEVTNPVFRFLSAFKHFDRLRFQAIYSKMRRISRREGLIRVDSAFGGLGLYRPSIFLQFDYSRANFEKGVYSEHVDLHFKASAAGFSLYIAPRLINSRLNEYNLNKIKFVRFMREVKKIVAVSKAQ